MRTSTRTGSKRTIRAASAFLALAMLAAACGGSESSDAGSDADAADGEAAADTDEPDTEPEPVPEVTDEEITLTLWSWSPGLEEQTALFEAEFPNITVEVVNAGQGRDQYERVRTAVQAGSGGPDVAHFATAFLPEFIITDTVIDLTPYGLAELEGDYPESAWSLVSTDGGLYGLPWDTGPLGFLYREDIFDEYGIDVPETWEDFAQAARDLHAQNDEIFLTQFPGVIPEMWMALAWQAGAKSFSVDGTTVGFDMVDDVAIELAEFWEPLLEEGVLATDPAFTTEWFSSLASGRYAAWIAPSWGPGLLQGAAEESVGLWRAAPLPQWEAGAGASAHWGGSTMGVLAQSEHPVEAAALIKFLLNDPEPAQLFTEVQLLFPTLNSILQDPAWAEQTFDFYGGQQVNQIFAEMELGVDTSWQWSPVHGFIDATLDTEMARGAQDADIIGALERTQAQVIEHAQAQGFTVNE